MVPTCPQQPSQVCELALAERGERGRQVTVDTDRLSLRALLLLLQHWLLLLLLHVWLLLLLLLHGRLLLLLLLLRLLRLLQLLRLHWRWLQCGGPGSHLWQLRRLHLHGATTGTCRSVA